MKAIIRREYGSPDVLELVDIDEPVVKKDEVLVRVQAAGVNMADVDYLLAGRASHDWVPVYVDRRTPRSVWTLRGRSRPSAAESLGCDLGTRSSEI